MAESKIDSTAKPELAELKPIAEMTTDEYIADTFMDGYCKYCGCFGESHFIEQEKDGESLYLLACCSKCGCDGTPKSTVVSGTVRPVENEWKFEKE